MKKFFTILIVFFVCHRTLAQCPANDVTLLSQSEVDNYFANGGCSVINGSLTLAFVSNLQGLSGITTVSHLMLTQSDVVDFSGLETLTEVSGDLNINQNEKLTNLKGLENLTSVGSIIMWSNLVLQDLNALSKITTTRKLTISDCNSLKNLNGLNNLKSVTGAFELGGNSALIDIQALGSLTHASTLNITLNVELPNLNGLENLTTVNSLSLEANLKLTSISALRFISSAPNKIAIRRTTCLPTALLMLFAKRSLILVRM